MVNGGAAFAPPLPTAVFHPTDMTTDLVLSESPPEILPASSGPTAVGGSDLYAALIADAKKPTTRRARVQDVGDVGRFLGSPSPEATCCALVAGGVSRANAVGAAYLESMRARGLSASTVNRRLSTIRRVCRLARRYELIGWTPEIDTLRSEPFRDTSGPGHTGWLRLLETTAKTAAKGPKGRRDLAMIRLLHDHGLRRAEVTALDLADVDLDGGKVWVMGKGKNEKTPMRLNKPSAVALGRWLDDRGAEPGPLFVRLDKARPSGVLTRIEGDGLHKVVGKLGSKAGLKVRVRPHGLRHEAITRVLELTNGNIDAAQKFGRHKDPKVTQRYNDNRKDQAGDMARILGEDS